MKDDGSFEMNVRNAGIIIVLVFGESEGKLELNHAERM